MSRKGENKRVTLNLDGEVSPSQFVRGVKDFFGILRSVSKNVTGEKSGVEWSISVRSGSNLIEARGFPTAATNVDKVLTTIDSIDTGLESLNSGTDRLPTFFTDKTLDYVRDLGNLAENSKDKGLEKVEVRVNGSWVRFGAQSVVSVNSIRGDKHEAVGSVEGRLQMVSDRRGYRFVIYDDLHDQRVECRFKGDDEILEQALNAFGKRVSVFGIVKYKQDGSPTRVKVERLRVFRPEEELPSIDSMQGIFNRSHE